VTPQLRAVCFDQQIEATAVTELVRLSARLAGTAHCICNGRGFDPRSYQHACRQMFWLSAEDRGEQRTRTPALSGISSTLQRIMAEGCGGGHGAQGRDGPHRQQIKFFQLLTTSSRLSFVPPFCLRSSSLLVRHPTIQRYSTRSSLRCPKRASNWLGRMSAKGRFCCRVFAKKLRAPTNESKPS
jgi:hypothetical protein